MTGATQSHPSISKDQYHMKGMMGGFNPMMYRMMNGGPMCGFKPMMYQMIGGPSLVNSDGSNYRMRTITSHFNQVDRTVGHNSIISRDQYASKPKIYVFNYSQPFRSNDRLTTDSSKYKTNFGKVGGIN